MNLNSNDEVVTFLRESGYPKQYNDGLLAWLRELYQSELTLPDLLHRYTSTYGNEIMVAALIDRFAAGTSFVEPAATFINTTPTDNGAGKTVLTSAGTHGLTNAIVVTPGDINIYVSAGTGWTPGFYKILAIDLDTTGVAITIDYPFSVSLGTPTIALANTEVVVASVIIPPLQANSIVELCTSYTSPDTSATNKGIRVRYEGTFIYSTSMTTSPTNRRVTTIHNRNSTSSQVTGMSITNVSGEGNNANAVVDLTVDTSVPTTITLGAQPAAANIVMTLESYYVVLYL